LTGSPNVDNAHPAMAALILLAAGESRRYGGIKQLADIDGETMVHRTARIALGSGAAVLVITGANADLVAAAVADLPVLVLNHPAWGDGMGSSLAAGIRHVQSHFPAASAALLCLADQPLLNSAWLADLLAAHRRSPDSILVTETDGVSGPPVLFPRDLFDELAQWSGSKGAQMLLQREAHRVQRLASPAGIDVDTPDDLRRAHDMLDAAKPR
jgi:molybdenum cofactor cytidylyltransferase